MQVKLPVLALAIAVFAWSAAAQTTAGTPGSTTTSQDAAASATAGMSGSTTITAVLDKSVDAKKAKVGEQVQAKATADARTASGTTIPTGSKLIGHVTEVKPHEKGANAQSSLGIQFDHAIVKGGQDVPIHAVIQAIAAPQQSAPVAGAPDITGGGGGYGQGGYGQGGYGTPAATGPRGGGAAQGAPTATAPTGGIARPAGAPTNTGDTGATSAGQVSANTTGVVGIRDLKLEPQGSEGSMITSDNKNVKLDSGTQLVLRVTPQ